MTSAPRFSRRHPGLFSNGYISTYLFFTAERMLRIIIMQNSRLIQARFPIKIEEIWIDPFCVRYDWWRRLQPTSSVSPVWSCSCLCSIHWSHVLSGEWRCSWSSVDKRCSNYILVINKFIAFKGASYIRGLTAHVFVSGLDKSYLLMLKTEYSGLLGQYHCCWCTGSWSRQSMRGHGIDCVGQKTCIFVLELIPYTCTCIKFKPIPRYYSKCE